MMRDQLDLQEAALKQAAVSRKTEAAAAMPIVVLDKMPADVDASDDMSDIMPLSGEVFGMLINLSGRRRFTSQRLVLYAVLASQGQPQVAATAREALKLFRDAHLSLITRGNGLPGVFCPELESAYFGMTQGDRKIRHFIDLAGRTLNAVEDGLQSAPALLDELVQFTTPLLAVLNEITAIYEEQSKKHARLMRKRLHSVMTNIETIAREAKMVAFNARIVAARAGEKGKEFAVVAGVLSDITTEIDELVRVALDDAAV
jgi:hypothetical protein